MSTEPGRGVPGAGAPITDFPLAIGDSLVAALVSYYAAQYKLHVGRETGSISLTADGYHSRMDTLTIGAVVVGLMGHAIGVPLDRMAAVVATYLLPGIYVVQPDERGVVKRLGRVVAAATKTRAQYVLDSFGAGAEIVAAHLQEITPRARWRTHSVTTRAREDRSRIIHEANGYANLIVPMARDDAQQLVTAAEGYRTEKVLTAEGESDRFRSTVVGTGRGRRCNTAALTRAFALDTETPQELDSVAFVSLDPRVRLRASGRFYRPASDNQWKG